MAKGIGPLLLIGGAVAVFALSKKKGGAVPGGMGIMENCSGVIITDQGAAFNLLLSELNRIAEREGIDVNTGAGLNASNLESFMAEIFGSAFPQCSWPPANPDSFMIGPEGMQQSWSAMIDLMLQQMGVQESMISASSTGPDPGSTMTTSAGVSLIQAVTK